MKKPAHYQSLEYDSVLRLFADLARARGEALHVLDFGCGPGKYALALKAQGCAVTGVDANPEYVRRASDHGITAYSSDAWPASDSSTYDAVLLSHVIEHLRPDELVALVPRLCARLAAHGVLVIVTPTFGERFFHDFSHIRPYLPQSVRHAFGQTGSPLSYGERDLIELTDIRFFKDPYRTRSWRSFYVGRGVHGMLTRAVNRCFDLAWRASRGRVGVVASWLGVYRLKPRAVPPAGRADAPSPRA